MNEDSIIITGLKVHANHGVYEDERTNGQIFIIDLVLTLGVRQASESDDITKTIDYSRLVEQVATVAKGDAVNLIETLAERIAATALQFESIQTVQVTVHKPNAPLAESVEDVAVRITRTK